MTSNHRPDAQDHPQDDSSARDPGGTHGNPFLHQSRLAADERDAALRALAGRLAHQIRNPLSAVRAACSGLRAEIEDPDQRETLELSLREIDRMLGFVTATVETIPESVERPVALDLGAELADVIAITRKAGTGHAGIHLGRAVPLPCRLPRDGLRATLYSLLEHLARAPRVDTVAVDLAQREDRALVSFAANGIDLSDDDLTTGMMSPTAWVQPVGLLVAERFARSVGGRLTRKGSSDTRLELTLELPSDV